LTHQKSTPTKESYKRVLQKGPDLRYQSQLKNELTFEESVLRTSYIEGFLEIDMDYRVAKMQRMSPTKEPYKRALQKRYSTYERALT